MTARLAVRLRLRIRRNPQPLHTFPRYRIRARRVVSRLAIEDANNCRATRQLQLMSTAYPVEFSIDYPDRDLNRLTTALRIFTVIPIAIVQLLRHNRVVGYAFILVTDTYPPFRLRP